MGISFQIRKAAINAFAKIIIGAAPYEQLKDIARVYVDSSLTGEQRREAVLKDAKDLGIELSTSLLNLGVELAVAYLKSKL